MILPLQFNLMSQPSRALLCPSKEILFGRGPHKRWLLHSSQASYEHFWPLLDSQRAERLLHRKATAAGASQQRAGCRRLHEELKSAGGSARLASQVASCLSKALQLLAEKAEYMAATGDAAR